MMCVPPSHSVYYLQGLLLVQYIEVQCRLYVITDAVPCDMYLTKLTVSKSV